jgi:hypothetical protein
MNQEYFTPGPWFRKGQRVYWKNPDKDLPRGTLPNGLICTCKSAEDWPECDEEARANAALIAAAPELYAALKEAAYEQCHPCIEFSSEDEYVPPSEEFVEHGCPKKSKTCFCCKWWTLLKQVRDGK